MGYSVLDSTSRLHLGLGYLVPFLIGHIPTVFHSRRHRSSGRGHIHFPGFPSHDTKTANLERPTRQPSSFSRQTCRNHGRRVGSSQKQNPHRWPICHYDTPAQPGPGHLRKTSRSPDGPGTPPKLTLLQVTAGTLPATSSGGKEGTKWAPQRQFRRGFSNGPPFRPSPMR